LLATLQTLKVNLQITTTKQYIFAMSQHFTSVIGTEEAENLANVSMTEDQDT